MTSLVQNSLLMAEEGAHVDAPKNRPEGAIASSAIVTLVLWTSCVLVGIIGVLVPYARPTEPVIAPPAVQAELIEVQLSNEPLPDLAQPSAPTMPQPPDLTPAALELPQTPALTPVAEAAKVEFAVPVAGPVRIVEAKQATWKAPAVVTDQPPAPIVPPVRQLTYGQGEGRQPAPEYPYRAKRAGQEGTVVVRFVVGQDGRVRSAEAARPAPWPLLNDAAVRAVRERWRFQPGQMRVYDVSIRFQLTS